MDDMELKNRMTEAIPLPEPPAALVERTVLRAGLITEGRSAERVLAEKGDTLPQTQRTALAAKSVAGRLMLTVEPPNGMTRETVTAQLEQSSQLQQLAALPPETFLQKMQTGEFLTYFREAESPAGAVPQEKRTAEPTAKPAPAEPMPR